MIVYNNIIPFQGYICVNLFGVLFVRKKYKEYEGTATMNKIFNHENIHTAQMKEFIYILFYLLYLLEWLYRLITPPFKTAYKDISFEREAYTNGKNMDYLTTRKHFSSFRYFHEKH